MANQILTPEIIAKESAMITENNLVAGSLTYKAYSPEFQKKGDSITVRKPASFVAKDFNDGTPITIQNATEEGVTLKLDKFKDVSFEVTSKELALDIAEFSGEFIQPAISAITQQIDSDILNAANEFPYFYERGANPALTDFAQMGKVLNNNKVPFADRYAVLNSNHYADYVAMEGIARVDASGSAEGLRKASMGEVMGFGTYLDQNMPKSNTCAASVGTATGTLGSNFFTVTGDVSALKNGVRFTVAGDTAVYAVTGVDIAAKKIFVDKAIGVAASAKALTFIGQKDCSLFFHKNAIALVSAPLELPSGANVATADFEGVTIRVVMGYDINTKKTIVSLDCLYGVAVINPVLGARLISA